MKVTGIDSGQIQAMLAQLKAAAQGPNAQATETSGGALSVQNPIQGNAQSSTVNFSDALKSALDQVNSVQLTAEKMGKNFAMGDDSVSLSDVMIAGQKASITFQATVQVRNKLVSAYSDIMNMQV
jgi:flagellar hook-basal body complex protein FliE